MLDLQRHTKCPLWGEVINNTYNDNKTSTSKECNNISKKKNINNNDNTTQLINNNDVIPWPGLEYACLKILEAYCKIFDRQEIHDLIVRYDKFYFSVLLLK